MVGTNEIFWYIISGECISHDNSPRSWRGVQVFVSVCLSVCLSVRMRSSTTIAPIDLIFTQEVLCPFLGPPLR